MTPKVVLDPWLHYTVCYTATALPQARSGLEVMALPRERGPYNGEKKTPVLKNSLAPLDAMNDRQQAGERHREVSTMLNDTSLAFIRSVAEEYGAARVLLFGSCLTGPEGEAKDIDLAVEGLSSKDYHAFWDRLLWAEELGEKPVDVIRVEDNGFLVPIILDEGAEIYADRKPQKIALYRV